jgi:hypothetical protein
MMQQPSPSVVGLSNESKRCAVVRESAINLRGILFFFAMADSIAEFLSQGLLNVLVAFMRPKRWMDGRELRNEIREEKKERKKEKNTLAPSQQ